MVLDWESARYTKPDKPLNAYDTLLYYYPSMENEIMPVLEMMEIASSNLPMDEDILEYANSLNDITIEDIIIELKSCIELLTQDKPVKLIK